ncbi:diguanylate cyclase domain-containing protein [Erythrobacter sp. QSSC1-22B]|uniref:GGDEF domain-containing protein n=1 Tax=Erythrobacter sp. QSSC1-22B TaxID=1860125 RepID=UPI00083578F4|nr:diguanylate cyclase [Erythrobacter sp. QSSC1-22B]
MISKERATISGPRSVLERGLAKGLPRSEGSVPIFDQKWCRLGASAAIADQTDQEGELTARYGGEEFAVILPHTDHKRALATGELIRSAVEALAVPHLDTAISSVVTVSVGVATAMAASGGTIEMPHGLLRAADVALYKAKTGGRNRVEGALLFLPKETFPTAVLPSYQP